MYEQQGYRLVADGYPGTDFTFDRDTATNQAYIVQLERITQTITQMIQRRQVHQSSRQVVRLIRTTQRAQLIQLTLVTHQRQRTQVV